MQIQPKSYHAYVALESFFLWLYQYAGLLSFRGHCCSDNVLFFFIYRTKFGECSHSTVISLGFMYFLCAVSETAKTLALECGWCVSIGHSTLEITQTFLINATMHFQDKPVCNSLSSIAEKQRAWNLWWNLQGRSVGFFWFPTFLPHSLQLFHLQHPCLLALHSALLP